MPNGLLTSPDDKTLYLIEADGRVDRNRCILAYDLSADGTPSNARRLIDFYPGRSGDGMAIDAAGRLYVTSAPGVQVFSPEGRYLGVIPAPRNPISVAFAGPGKRTLYIVGSGALGPDGKEFTTPAGVRNNAKTIYKIPMLAEGYQGRAR